MRHRMAHDHDRALELSVHDDSIIASPPVIRVCVIYFLFVQVAIVSVLDAPRCALGSTSGSPECFLI